ncbi:hypothetical protein NE237_033236 [Protea cynaroides]|uniref:Uncharacterized protein n=1 Tax=Protea cynaroides TaxID=273540 RepID=A0A9Q0L4W6_9MAGN|nr:hypothetical protein NE237_033236 [Protea cynaroides]
MSKESMLALRAKMVRVSRGTEKATKSSLVVASKHGAITALPTTQVSEVTKEKSRKRGRDLIPQGREDPLAIGTDDCADKVRKIGLMGLVPVKKRGDETVFCPSRSVVTTDTVIGDPRIAAEIVSDCILPRDSEMVRSLPTASLCSGSDTFTIVAEAKRDSAESKLVAKEEECRTWKAKSFTLTSKVDRLKTFNEDEKNRVMAEIDIWKNADKVSQVRADRGCNLLVDVAMPPFDEELDDDDLYEKLGEILDAEDAEKGHSKEGPSGCQTLRFGFPMRQGLVSSPNPLPATPSHDLSSPDPSARDSRGTPPSDPAARDSAGDPR